MEIIYRYLFLVMSLSFLLGAFVARFFPDGRTEPYDQFFALAVSAVLALLFIGTRR